MSPEIAVGQPEKSNAQTNPQSLTLWKIERDLSILVEAREEADTAEGQRACEQALTEYAVREVQKADNIIGYIRQSELMAEAAKEEAERIMEWSERWKKRAEVVRKATIAALDAAGKTCVEGRTGKLAIQPNGGKQKLDIFEEEKVPARYDVITTEIDRDAVRKDLEAGIEVPGARLLERGRHLRIT